MGISPARLWSFFFELITHELTNLLGEAFKGYNHGKISKSYLIGRIGLKSRSIDFNHEMEFGFGIRTFEHITIHL